MKLSHNHYKYKRRIIVGLSFIILLIIYFFKNSSSLLRSISFIALIVFFYIADHVFDIRFQPKHYIFIILIGVSSLLLSPLYYIYPNYDKIQHLIQPMLLGSMIFYMVSKLPLQLKWKLTFTFFITVGLLGLFEIGEYGLDLLFNLKLQGVYLRDIHGVDKFNLVLNRIDDTMIDLIFGVSGVSIYIIGLFLYLRKKN
ncbi:hypothetical protein KW787_00840 [Candidatus Pacearchaeota archaeon]|nr:hypothetical protein [Candidatus Pacearchaeota archaeon]